MPFNEVAKPVFKIERPYTYINIVRAMADNENDVVYHRIQNYSHSTVLLFHPSKNDVEQSYVEVQLRDTVILRYWEDGKITLNAGDWHTKWTRMYLNDWLKGIAEVVADKKNPWTLVYKGINHTFFNSMIIDTVSEEIIGECFDVEAVKKQRQEIDKLIEEWWKGLEPTDLEDIVEYGAGYSCDECEDYGHHNAKHLKEHLIKGEYIGAMFRRAWLDLGKRPYWLTTVAKSMHRDGSINPWLRRYITRWLRRQLYTGPITF